MATFDPNNFLHLTTTEASVKLPPLPPGEYVGVIGEVSASTWVEKNPKDGKAPGTGPKFEFPITLQIPAEVQAELGYPDWSALNPMEQSISVSAPMAVCAAIGKLAISTLPANHSLLSCSQER